MAAEQGGGGGLRQGRLISVHPVMAQEEKKGKTKYFFGPHTKSQSNFFTRFHYVKNEK
jgi:hypothetical protein